MSLINKKWRYINNNLIHAIWDQTLAKHGRNNKKETSESEKFENKHPERSSRSEALPGGPGGCPGKGQRRVWWGTHLTLYTLSFIHYPKSVLPALLERREKLRKAAPLALDTSRIMRPCSLGQPQVNRKTKFGSER